MTPNSDDSIEAALGPSAGAGPEGPYREVDLRRAEELATFLGELAVELAAQHDGARESNWPWRRR
jgi:hypothetical protein